MRLCICTRGEVLKGTIIRTFHTEKVFVVASAQTVLSLSGFFSGCAMINCALFIALQ